MWQATSRFQKGYNFNVTSVRVYVGLFACNDKLNAIVRRTNKYVYPAISSETLRKSFTRRYLIPAINFYGDPRN